VLYGPHVLARLNVAEMEIALSLSVDIKTVRVDGDGAFGATLERVRTFLELDNLLLWCPLERTKGWGVERIEATGFPSASRLGGLLLDYLQHAPYRFWFFDPIYPESDQRDRVVDTIEMVGTTAYRSSRIFGEVIDPLGFGQHREVRALICDGRNLVGWVGSLHGKPIHPEQRVRLNSLLPALRLRLLADRAIRARTQTAASIAAALDRIGPPAFIVSANGEVLATNRSARARLDEDRASSTQELDAILHGQSAEYAERIALRGSGSPPALLIVMPDRSIGYVEQCVVRASQEWGLTPRQCDVLRLVVRGQSTAAIAEQLGVGERAIELHVTVLLERSRTTSRTGLVASVLAPG
jgi:DNA-binding CsgD family transcriptional regulator